MADSATTTEPSTAEPTPGAAAPEIGGAAGAVLDVAWDVVRSVWTPGVNGGVMLCMGVLLVLSFLNSEMQEKRRGGAHAGCIRAEHNTENDTGFAFSQGIRVIADADEPIISGPRVKGLCKCRCVKHFS